MAGAWKSEKEEPEAKMGRLGDGAEGRIQENRKDRLGGDASPKQRHRGGAGGQL